MSATPEMSSAYERNRDPILGVLKQLIPRSDSRIYILEIASGYGHHVTYFAQQFDNITWQPSDCDKSCMSYLTQHIKKLDPMNMKILKPIVLDAMDEPNKWLESAETNSFDFVLCINMTHISKWESTQGLFLGSSFYLKPGGVLIIYGPFIIYGDFVHENNINFDKYLRQQNHDWGMRDVAELCKLGESFGLALENIIDMPANNKTLIFRKH